jgi:hypothetical protein
MLRLLKPTSRLAGDYLSRREWLQAGGLGILGLGLPSLLRAEGKPHPKDPDQPGRQGKEPGQAKACIMIWLAGGPSQPDMWDMKPEAPVEIRGEFKPIATTVPGILMCEHLPRLARQAHHVTLVRSAHHRIGYAHCSASYFVLTGDNRGDLPEGGMAFGTGPNDRPGIGSVLARFRPPERPVVSFVSAPYVISEGIGGPPSPGIYGGWMGRTYDPFEVNRHRSETEDPNSPHFGFPELTLRADVDPGRLNDRRGLLGQVNSRFDALQRTRIAGIMDAYQQRAFTLLTSDLTRRAFDLSREPDPLRERYGRNIYGQTCLLARRLVEAGTRMVMVRWAPDCNATWDTHGTIANQPPAFKVLKETLLPQLDAGLGTLIEDLHLHGLLDETLVVVMGEFGRSPKVNPWAGRDHWPRCYSVLLAGGGVRGGHIYGQSDKIGADPAENPVTPHDLVATFYSLLGIPPETELPDQLGRPVRLGGPGQVLRGVMV